MPTISSISANPAYKKLPKQPYNQSNPVSTSNLLLKNLTSDTFSLSRKASPRFGAEVTPPETYNLKQVAQQSLDLAERLKEAEEAKKAMLAITWGKESESPPNVAQYRLIQKNRGPKKESPNIKILTIWQEVFNRGLTSQQMEKQLKQTHPELGITAHNLRDFQRHYLEKISKFKLNKNRPIPQIGSPHYKILTVWKKVFNRGLTSKQMEEQLKETHPELGITAHDLRDFQRDYLTLN